MGLNDLLLLCRHLLVNPRRACAGEGYCTWSVCVCVCVCVRVSVRLSVR